MANENKISSFLNKRKVIIPILFSLMVVCLIACIIGFELKTRFDPSHPLDHNYAFNIGGEICAIAVGVMVTLSILPTYRRQSGYIRVFVTAVACLAFTMAFDVGEALVDGIPELVWLNQTFATLVWVNETITIFMFWIYATHVLKLEGKTMFYLECFGVLFLFAFILIPIITVAIGKPLYFTVDPVSGLYSRLQPQWWISRIPHTYFIVAAIITIVLSKQSLKSKIIISVFMGLPIIAMGSGGYKTGVAIEYIAMMMSAVLIYASLFSENEKDLYTTNKELGIATNIQKHMLPSIFPAFPERKEFDVYALMSPAKEVGGDFYDFFLVDEDHLAMVIADVSDKGVPAALFMMASKIMVQNYTMMGKSPAKVLEAVNNQICHNNQEDMFVTVWLGILDLRTGLLTAANAGHEKPLIKKANEHFEMYKDKNGFVVGWYKDTPYKEYQLQLDKGSKIFLYTDGVPEASSVNGQFTRERMIKTVNKYRDCSPQELVENVKDDIDLFVGTNDQFDDITMLCVEFKGYEK